MELIINSMMIALFGLAFTLILLRNYKTEDKLKKNYDFFTKIVDKRFLDYHELMDKKYNSYIAEIEKKYSKIDEECLKIDFSIQEGFMNLMSTLVQSEESDKMNLQFESNRNPEEKWMKKLNLRKALYKIVEERYEGEIKNVKELSEYSNSEKFLDEIIDRIQRKQLK